VNVTVWTFGGWTLTEMVTDDLKLAKLKAQVQEHGNKVRIDER
jgi:hypothetical protein